MMTDSGVTTIFIYKGLTRNPEIGNAQNFKMFAQYLETGASLGY